MSPKRLRKGRRTRSASPLGYEFTDAGRALLAQLKLAPRDACGVEPCPPGQCPECDDERGRL